MPADKHIRNRYLIQRTSLWVAIITVSSVFCVVGLIELLMPISTMAEILSWVDGHPLWFTRSLGIIDIAGGVGILLPFLFQKFKKLITFTATGCVSKQVVALCFHLSIGEPSVAPLNIALLVLSAFILWSHKKETHFMTSHNLQSS